ncbi:tyrosine-type recombinase/integrase, partial [Pseudobacteroides cellulosolvens]
SEPSDKLFQEYLSDNKNKYTGKYSVLKERQRIRVVNLIKSYISDGEVNTSRKNGKSASDGIQTETLKNEFNRFAMILKENQLQPNTIYTYKRIVAYLLIYCEEKSYRSINELSSGDIRNFILYLYEHGYFKPTTIASGLSGLKRFLSLHPDIKHLIMELPTRLPREHRIIEIYRESETSAINEILSGGNLTKRDKAICLLLLETGLRAVDICNIKLTDIDWNKDVIYIRQQKTGMALNIPLRKSYGNTIVDYILNERPECNSKYLFVRELAPFTRLNGEGSSIRSVLLKMEALAGISNEGRVSGSRMTRHNAASVMLRSGVSMTNISAVLGHTDQNIVSVYLSTNETTMAACTLPLPGGVRK